MRIISLVSKGFFALAAYVCLPVIIGVIGADVVLRYAFNAPLIWAQEAATLALFLAIGLALPESWRRGVHIKADFVTATMSRGLANALARASWLMLAGVSGLIVVQCWRDIDLMILFRERSTELHLHLAWFRAVLGTTATVCALLSLIMLFARHPAMSPDEDRS